MASFYQDRLTNGQISACDLSHFSLHRMLDLNSIKPRYAKSMPPFIYPYEFAADIKAVLATLNISALVTATSGKAANARFHSRTTSGD
jgi:hypothetical protein